MISTVIGAYIAVGIYLFLVARIGRVGRRFKVNTDFVIQTIVDALTYALGWLLLATIAAYEQGSRAAMQEELEM